VPATRPPAVLFDLDGTLIDSIELILNSARHAFDGRENVPSEAEWLAGVGTPLATMFRKYTSNEAEVEALIARYREYQLPNHDRLVRPYPGVVETVRELHGAGHPLGIVTSKTEVLAKRGIDLVGIARFFDVVVGVDSTTKHKPDPAPVLAALRSLDRRPDEAFFVGDSVHDMLAGKAAGVVTIAALWGPFGRADVAPGGPTHYLEEISGLGALLKG